METHPTVSKENGLLPSENDGKQSSLLKKTKVETGDHGFKVSRSENRGLSHGRPVLTLTLVP